jgi:hypothetical protein
MALSTDNRLTLNQICALISQDPTLCQALRSSAERLASPTNRDAVWRVLARNANFAVQGTQLAALEALIADIAEN